MHEDKNIEIDKEMVEEELEAVEENLDNTSYVQTLYRMLFDRAADTTGLNAWVTKLNNGKTREAVLDGFLNSQEFIELAKKYGIRRK